MNSCIDKLNNLFQHLEHSNIPYGQWGQNVHLLVDRANDGAAGVDPDIGMDEGGFECGGGDFDAPSRMDYGFFDWAKADSLESEDEDENDSDDEMESSAADAPSLDNFLRPRLAKAPRFGMTEAKRKTQNKLQHWSKFISCLSEKAGSELSQSCNCVKATISLPAVTLNGMYQLKVVLMAT